MIGIICVCLSGCCSLNPKRPSLVVVEIEFACYLKAGSSREKLYIEKSSKFYYKFSK